MQERPRSPRLSANWLSWMRSRPPLIPTSRNGTGGAGALRRPTHCGSTLVNWRRWSDGRRHWACSRVFSLATSFAWDYAESPMRIRRGPRPTPSAVSKWSPRNSAHLSFERHRLRSNPVAVVGVLALQGDVREHLQALTSAGADAVAVRRPEELAKVDGLVLPGGESTTIVKLAKIFEIFEPLRERIADGLPVYGSCAGMILLADRVDAGGSPLEATFGGIDITVRRNAFGRQVDSFEEDLAIDGIVGAPMRAVFIRAPWVQQVGPAAQAIGHVTGGEHAGRVVAVRQGNLLATSFHPELTGDARIHALFVALVREAG